MNKFKNYILMAAGFAILAAVISGITAGSAIAQLVKAAIVKNVDERGRIPYQLVLSCSGTSTCTGSGPAVPPNTRLVIEHVNGEIKVPSGETLTDTELDGSSNYYLPSHLQLHGGGGVGDYYYVNEQVLEYFNSGETPRIQVEATSSGSISIIHATVTGYLVDLTR